MADIFDDELEVPEPEEESKGNASATEVPEGDEPGEGNAEGESSAAEQTGDAAVPAEGNAERLLAGKYRTPEDLERAYTDLQNERGRLAQELGETRKRLSMYLQRDAAARPQHTLSDQEKAQRRREALRKFLEDPESAIQEAAQRIIEERQRATAARYHSVQEAVNHASRELAEVYPDMNAISPAMQREFEQNPMYMQAIESLLARGQLTPQAARYIGEQLYWAAKGRLAAEGQRAATKSRDPASEAAAKLAAAATAAGKPSGRKLSDDEKEMAELLSLAAADDEF